MAAREALAKLVRFRQVWLVDFEFSQSPGHVPEPVCCVARDTLGEYVLPFRCQRTKNGWINHNTKTPLHLSIVGWKY